ncbi:uncharacterized protein LOC106945926 [Poecilia latipinna]|nr:PREDICTED: uncharacterized protein LOC106945926 [Poecilia latipinna]XP_014885435.1 PREDICTED: uncharacterized protein LOC106945926 [Poecilia latipinna]XP_014885442.1 PREDICTED: uncharacterized protein LOC106945926 [Poecilia latipinna]
METSEVEVPAIPTEEQPAPNHGPPYPKKKKKKKQHLHSADIVFSKGHAFLSVPSLSKVLKDITDSIIGLQYVWEYRSPSKMVQPHYQCKLCSLSRVQHDMVDHVKGWKHSFRYMKKNHPDKVIWEEEDGVKDPAIRKAVKVAAAEVEKAEGRGQIRVILKEPYLVLAFKGLRSAVPRPIIPRNNEMRPMGPPFGPRFHDTRFPGEFATHGGSHPGFPCGEYEEPAYGGYMSGPAFPDSSMAPAPYANSIGPGQDGYGRSEPMVESSNTAYTNEYQENSVDRPISKPVDRPGLLGAAPQSSNMPAVLKHLESFQIENENDAQLVLKVTQRLTDVLMEYRLRTIPAASTFCNPSLNFSNTPPRLQNDRYSSNHSGSSRYPDPPQKYFN